LGPIPNPQSPIPKVSKEHSLFLYINIINNIC
jgi:hypothetical protein